jgi:hypothetical protein
LYGSKRLQQMPSLGATFSKSLLNSESHKAMKNWKASKGIFVLLDEKSLEENCQLHRPVKQEVCCQKL